MTPDYANFWKIISLVAFSFAAMVILLMSIIAVCLGKIGEVLEAISKRSSK